MTTLIEKSILNERLEKSRSGIYADTSENRRKHRVGQKYGSEKKEEEKPEKTDPNKMSPEQQLEAINKVIAAINEGKLKLPPEEINTLVAKKTMAEEAVKQAKGEKKPEKKEESKKEATKPEAKAEAASSLSPILKQYYDLKAKYPNALLLCRSGDFYHTYSNDAEKAAKILGITLTRSNRTKDIEGKPLGMAGFPSHALDIYLPKLIRAGERVAIYDQIEAPKERTRDEKIKENEAQEEPKKEESRGEKKTDKASDPIYQVQQKKKEASKKYDSKREEARQKYDKEADEIRSEIDKLYESDHSDAAKKRKELWNTLKEKTNKYDAETSRLKDEYEAEYKKLDEAEDKLYDQRQKEETSEEVKESYTRVKFEDVPNSGKVNLKKYLSDKVKRTADENLGILSKVSTENLKKMEAGLVKEFNSQFDDLPKARRAEKLYSIMKVKAELATRGKENQKTDKTKEKETSKSEDKSRVEGKIIAEDKNKKTDSNKNIKKAVEEVSANFENLADKVDKNGWNLQYIKYGDIDSFNFDEKDSTLTVYATGKGYGNTEPTKTELTQKDWDEYNKTAKWVTNFRGEEEPVTTDAHGAITIAKELKDKGIDVKKIVVVKEYD